MKSYITNGRRLRVLVIASVVLASAAGAARIPHSPRPLDQRLYRTTGLSMSDVAVSCRDGGKPIVQEVATDKRIIIVSCPSEAEENAPRGKR